MERKTAIGWQSFEAMRNLNIFYVDKTGLIKNGGITEMQLRLLHVQGVLVRH